MSSLFESPLSGRTGAQTISSKLSLDKVLRQHKSTQVKHSQYFCLAPEGLMESLEESFVAQSDHGIDAHRPPRRYVARKKRYT